MSKVGLATGGRVVNKTTLYSVKIFIKHLLFIKHRLKTENTIMSIMKSAFSRSLSSSEMRQTINTLKI